MKKSIIVCTILLTLSTIATKAQEASKHEINVSYSDGVPMALVDGFANAFSSAILGQKTNSNTKSFGNIGLGYRNQITERIRIGGDVALQQEETKITDKKDQFMGKRTNLYIMVLPTISFSYIKTAWLDFYGTAGAGVLLNRYTQTVDSKASQKDNMVDFAFQVNPVGIRVGKKLVDLQKQDLDIGELSP